MTSDAVKVMDKLKDLRITRAGDSPSLLRALHVQLPPAYNPDTLAAIPVKERMDARGLEALIVVIRRLVAHIADEFSDSSNPEIAKQERENPLLRLAMSDFGGTAADVPESDFAAAAHLALEALCGDDDRSAARTSFASLSEGELMQRTFWKRRPFLLCHPKFLVREGDDDPWEWHDANEDPGELENLAKTSLIHFEGGDISKIIESHFGRRTTRDGKLCFFMHSNTPTVLRVRYTVPKKDPLGYKELQNISVIMPELERYGAKKYKLSWNDYFQASYRLIAEVRLSTELKVKDTVRTYTQDGAVIPMPYSFKATHMDEKLGKPGATYILYYGLVASILGINPDLPEVIDRDATRAMRMMDYFRHSSQANSPRMVLPGKPPPPTRPRVEREQEQETSGFRRQTAESHDGPHDRHHRQRSSSPRSERRLQDSPRRDNRHDDRRRGDRYRHPRHDRRRDSRDDPRRDHDDRRDV
ncbi:hypothetical protein F4805DRAFT_474183 [Annulohypoxylon moriforme]|nr:hypothetical protein F4805DRAFT_474183 [Annulohypoxylon moriforme]